MFLRACVRVFCLRTCWRKYFADAILAVYKGGVHQPLKQTNENAQRDAIEEISATNITNKIHDSS